MRKPRAGACGICGAAVEIPSDAEVDARMHRPNKGNAAPAQEWVSGHLYDNGDGGPHVLKRVRCLDHAEEHDPRLGPPPGSMYWTPGRM